MKTLQLQRNKSMNFEETSIVAGNIGKYNANIFIHPQDNEVRGQFPRSGTKTLEIAL